MTDTPRDATAIFDAHAARYDDARRRLIPPFDAFYGTVVEAITLGGRPLRRILDLGAGTGLLAARVAAAAPGAQITLLDGSAPMLEQARARLRDDPRFAFVQGDLRDPLPDGPWDAVVSALAIHHLRDPDKRALYARLREALPPDAILVNADQVAAPSGLFADHYLRWHEARARAAGSDDAEWSATLDRWQHDWWATVEQQLGWLREAGFVDADCLFKDRSFAVLVARR